VSLEDVATHALEMKKALSQCRAKKEVELQSSTTPLSNAEVDASDWGDLGLYFWTNRMYQEMIVTFSHMLSAISRLEKKFGHIHKGLPLYNMGIAQIGLANFDQGIPNVLKAFDEDKLKLGEIAAKKELAYKLKDDLLDFTARIVDNNYLKEFVTTSGLGVNHILDLLTNMEEPEKLFFAKLVNSRQLVDFHEDAYTKAVLFDNLKNLCLILESNLRRRKGVKGLLPRLVVSAFSKEPWITYFDSERKKRTAGLTGYSDVRDFNWKVRAIEAYSPIGTESEDFHLKNFLATTLIRNFTAHNLDESIEVLNGPQEYENAFSRVLWSLIYALQYGI
jgi:hypothetical protein